LATYVLVHGAFHGSWCWDKVAPLLLKRGFKVEAPDLPSHGKDKTPIRDVTLQRYVEKVCEVLDAQAEPAILVGHSMSGIVISQAAEYRPNKIRVLVYLAAILLRNGESMSEQLDSGRPILNFADNGSYVSMKEELISEQFYGGCSSEDIVRAKLLLGLQPTAPLRTPLNISKKNFGRIPRVYIETLRDKAVPLDAQRRMYEALPCSRIISMNTGHSPFFCAPEKLAANLAALADWYPS
jgi:pimeloyl-ACP methyl ester carboxylesterase